MRLLTLLLLLPALLVAPSVAAPKEKKEEERLPVPPPQPVPVKISVARLGSVDIPLKIYGSQREPLKFPIRSKPVRGKLGPVVSTGRESAQVRYEPPPDLLITSEKFTYAAQNSAGVSAPAEVLVEIIDDPVRLIVPMALRFDLTLAGRTTKKELTIVNEGGGMAEGELQVPAPWRVQGAPDYRLGHGERRTYTIVFAPTAPGPARAELRYSSHLDRTTTLEGEAEAPLSFEPPTLELAAAAGDPVRSGAVEVVNHTDAPLTLSLPTDPRWHLPAELKVPANGREVLLVRLDAKDTAAVEEKLEIAGGGLASVLPVRGKAVPAILQAESRTLTLPLDQPAMLALRNAGALEGHWKAQIPAPFQVSPASVKLDPLGEASVSVRLGAGEPGEHSGVLRFTGEQQTLEVKVTGTIRPPMPPAGAAPPPAAVTASAPPAPKVEYATELPPVNSSAPRAKANLRLVQLRPASVTVAWPEGLTRGQTVRAETMGVAVVEKQAREVWTSYADFTVETIGGETKLTLLHLQPGRPYFVKLLATQPGNPRAQEIFSFNFTTPAKEGGPWFTWMRLLVLALLVCGGLAVWQWRKRQGAA